MTLSSEEDRATAIGNKNRNNRTWFLQGYASGQTHKKDKQTYIQTR